MSGTYRVGDEWLCDDCGAVVHVLDVHSPHEDGCTLDPCTCDRTVCEDCCPECVVVPA